MATYDEFKKVETPEGVYLSPCPVCKSEAELWRHSSSPADPTETAVCCSNHSSIGPQGKELYSGCLLYMPPDEFYKGTIREAVRYWNEYATAIEALRCTNTPQVLKTEINGDQSLL